ncbi:MAG: pantetheine-phosphate adenylyltransferase [Eubacteriaceae bacterium]|jgi:pantetheine-phosphate adenylyltransferase
MKTVVYPGSFDPITTGHLDIIRRASQLFDKVVIVIMKNVEKKGLFTYNERRELVGEAIRDMENVECCTSRGLLTDFLRANDLHYIIKGIRNSADFLYELDMDRFNKQLYPECETMYLAAEPDQVWVSSSAVRELISYGADISPYVPPAVLNRIVELRRNAI